MFNWLRKLLGREHTITVDGAQVDRMQRAAKPRTPVVVVAGAKEYCARRGCSAGLTHCDGFCHGVEPDGSPMRASYWRSAMQQTPPRRLPPSPPPLRQVREDNRRRDSTDEVTPLLWPVLVSDGQMCGMDSMSASLAPAEPPAFSNGGGGDYGGGGASGSWDSGSSSGDSGSSSSDSSSSSSD